MVAVRASGVLGAVALGAGMLIATPASAGTSGVGTAAGAHAGAGATQCMGVAPTYAEVLVRAAWTETIEHPATWVTESRYTRRVVDQPYRPGVPEVSHVERTWSKELLEGWTPTGETRYVVTRPAVPATPEIEEQTERRMVDSGQPAVPPTVALVHHPAETRIVHHPAVWETVHHEAVVRYEFRQDPTGKTRWETDPGWNAEANPQSQGWVATGATRTDPARDEEVKVSDAYDEEVVVTEAWVEERVVDPGQEYVAPTYATVVVVPYRPPVPAVPEQGYTEHEYTRVVVTRESEPEVEKVGHPEERWATSSPGEGWEDTGTTRQVEVGAPWTEEVHHRAVYELRMTSPGVTCPVPGGGGAGGSTTTVVPVRNVVAGPGVAPTASPVPAERTARTASVAGSQPSVATLPATGPSTGLLTAAILAAAAGAALLAVRSWAGRVADGVGRHRLDRARDTAAATAGGRPRWNPFRRRAHRRTA